MAHGYCIAQHNCNLFFCNTVVSVWKPFLMLLSPCPFGPSPLWPALLLYSTFVTCDIDRARPAWNIICWPGPSVFFFDFYPSRLLFSFLLSWHMSVDWGSLFSVIKLWEIWRSSEQLPCLWLLYCSFLSPPWFTDFVSTHCFGSSRSSFHGPSYSPRLLRLDWHSLN